MVISRRHREVTETGEMVGERNWSNRKLRRCVRPGNALLGKPLKERLGRLHKRMSYILKGNYQSCIKEMG